jgi:NAD(P)-dependent dehydrogenase (short-subunit alcohol dehydrogenase family)
MAQVLHALNYMVFILGRDLGKLVQVARDDEFGAMIPIKCDISNETSIQEAFLEINEHVKHIDVLINNAADFGPTVPLMSLKAEDLNKSLQTNITGPYLCVQYANLLLRESCRRPSILNVGSITATAAYTERDAYVASKGALIPMTRNMAAQLAPDIIVWGIMPGHTLTDNLGVVIQKRAESQNKTTDQVQEELKGKYAIEELLDPDHIAQYIAYVVDNDMAKFFIGHMIPISLGYCL